MSHPRQRRFQAGSSEAAPGSDQPQRSFFDRAKRPLAAAWVASLCIHLILLALAAVISFGGAQAGGARAEAETIGIAVLTEAEFGQLSDTALDASTPTVTDALDDPLAINVDLRIPEALAAFDEPLDFSSAATELTAGLGAGDVADGALGGTGGAASFFGVEAKGTRFAYIVDISGSMDIGIGSSNTTRMDVLRAQLQNSISSLSENSRFFVVLFSHDAHPLGGRTEWTSANDAGKAWGRRAIMEIQAQGGTEPLGAFRMVFSIRPRPEAIYFMTDGEFFDDIPSQVARFNGDLRIPIHTICFASQEGEAAMRRIAEDSGGSYTYIPGSGR